MRKVLLTILIVVSFVSTKTIHVNVDTAYSSGEFTIDKVVWVHDTNENDTVVFSNGTVITFINSYGMHSGAGGLCVLDSVSTLIFKGEGEKDFSFHECDIYKTENKIAENWYWVNSLPDSQFEADTFTVGDIDNGQRYQASYFYVMSGQDGGPAHFYLADDSKCMNYISTEGITLKLQLYDQGVWEGNEFESGDIGNLKFRWAVDSAGNGLFKHVLFDSVAVQSHYDNALLLNKNSFSPDEEVDSIAIFEYPKKDFSNVRVYDEGIQYRTFLESEKEIEIDTLIYRVSTNKQTYDVVTHLNITVNESFANNDTMSLPILNHELDPVNGVIITPIDTDFEADINVLYNDSSSTLKDFRIMRSPNVGYASEESDGKITYMLPKDSILIICEKGIMLFDSLDYCVSGDNGALAKGTLFFEALLDPINIINTIPKQTINYRNTRHKEINIYSMSGRLIKRIHNAKISDIDTRSLSAGSYIISFAMHGSLQRMKFLVK